MGRSKNTKLCFHYPKEWEPEMDRLQLKYGFSSKNQLLRFTYKHSVVDLINNPKRVKRH